MAVFTTESLVKEKVSKTTHEKLPRQGDQCDYKYLRKMNLKRHMLKHNGITKPETRGRKKKNGLLSERFQLGRVRQRMETTRQREWFLGLERI